jgi:hypothetical protein
VTREPCPEKPLIAHPVVSLLQARSGPVQSGRRTDNTVSKVVSVLLHVSIVAVPERTGIQRYTRSGALLALAHPAPSVLAPLVVPVTVPPVDGMSCAAAHAETPVGAGEGVVVRAGVGVTVGAGVTVAVRAAVNVGVDVLATVVAVVVTSGVVVAAAVVIGVGVVVGPAVAVSVATGVAVAVGAAVAVSVVTGVAVAVGVTVAGGVAVAVAAGVAVRVGVPVATAFDTTLKL